MFSDETNHLYSSHIFASSTQICESKKPAIESTVVFVSFRSHCCREWKFFRKMEKFYPDENFHLNGKLKSRSAEVSIANGPLTLHYKQATKPLRP